MKNLSLVDCLGIIAALILTFGGLIIVVKFVERIGSKAKEVKPAVQMTVQEETVSKVTVEEKSPPWFMIHRINIPSSSWSFDSIAVVYDSIYNKEYVIYEEQQVTYIA